MLADVDAERMIIKLDFGSCGFVAHVPLAFVTAAWLDEHDLYNIDMRGAFNVTKVSGGPPFVPNGSVA